MLEWEQRNDQRQARIWLGGLKQKVGVREGKKGQISRARYRKRSWNKQDMYMEKKIRAGMYNNKIKGASVQARFHVCM